MADEPNTPTGAENQVEPPTDGGNKPSGAATFTQKDIDRVLTERLQREREKWEARVAEASAAAVEAFRDERGLTDDALSAIGKPDEEKVAMRAEIRKLKGDLTRQTGEATSVSEKLKTITSKLHGLLVHEQIVKAAAPIAAGGDTDPFVALLGPRIMVDESTHETYVVDENGERSSKTVPELVVDLAEQKPHLAAASGRYGSGSSPRATMGRSPEPGDSTERRLAILRKAGLG